MDEVKNNDNVSAYKSLSSMIISLLSVVGIVLTIVLYYLVSPSFGAMGDTSGYLLSSMVSIAKATESNSEALYQYSQYNAQTNEYLISMLNSTVSSLENTREFISELDAKSADDYSNYTLSLKQSEDQLKLVSIKLAVQNSNRPPLVDLNEDVTKLQKYSSELKMSLGALNTLFTGMTVILILIFVSLIVLSTEDLIS